MRSSIENILNPAALLLVAAGLLVLTHPRSAFAQADQQQNRRGHEAPTLTVTGHGSVNAKPDIATVRLAVEAQGDTAASAQQAVNSSMQKVLQDIEKVGVDKQFIQTTDIHLTPIYSAQRPGQETSEPPHILGYRASNTIQVTLNDLRLVGKVIDAGTSAGANRLEGVSFDVQNDVHYRADALGKAAQNARQQAHALADALGIKLGPVQKVDQVSVNMPRPMSSFGRERLSMVSTPVEPGEITIDASVMVSYRIQPTAR